ncbi:hypothetical protein [Lysinibacillus xylanilyticus]|uniref:hypothetical protein n=1 Tax=Lysinibacillus xylanilyticus TaxID=582475 RepID=UPI0036DEB2D8
MRFYDGRNLIYDSETGFKASEMTEESLKQLGGPDVVALKLHEATDLILPWIKNKSLTDKNVLNITNWFRDMIQNSDKKKIAFDAIKSKLAETGQSFTDEDVEAIVNVPLELNANRSTSVPASFLEYTSGDMQATTILRRRVMVDDVSYKYPNITLDQDRNTDPVGIRLPQADVIVAHTLGEPYADTPFQDTYTQYPNRLYRMKQIVSILTSNTAEIRLQHINNTIKMLKTMYGLEIPSAEVRKLRSSFEVLPLEWVIGNPDNDSVGIQENEQAFYENLVAFIKYHIHKFNKEIMVNASEEEIKAKSEEDFNNGVLPVRVGEYLDQLVKDVLYSNFYHTGNFNYLVGDLRDPDEEAKETDDDDTGMVMTKEDNRQSDLNVVASSYLGLSARTFGASVWAEGIVKLMRWGDRKVKNLNVGVNNTQYLDLQSMHLITQQLADLSNFTVDADDDGRSLDLLGCMYSDFKPEGVKRAQSYPFVLLAKEYGFVPGVTEAVTINYLTTLFDVVNSYVKGEGKVFDLSFVDGKFVDETERDDLAVLDLEELNNGNCKVKISDDLTDYAIDNNVSKMQGTAFSLLRQDEFEEFASSEPLVERLAETPKPLRSSVVQGGLLSIFQEGASNFEDTNLVNLLNWYHEEIYPTHLEAYNKLFGFASSGDTKSKLNAKNLPTANFFGQGKVVGEVTDVEEASEIINGVEERVEFMYPVYEGEQLDFSKIIKSPKDETLIGGYALTPEGDRVFASKDEIESFAVESKTVHTGQVLLGMFETMLTADTNNGYTSKTKVISPDSLYKIYKALAGQA